jgi:hypothetical protein
MMTVLAIMITYQGDHIVDSIHLPHLQIHHPYRIQDLERKQLEKKNLDKFQIAHYKFSAYLTIKKQLN